MKPKRYLLKDWPSLLMTKSANILDNLIIKGLYTALDRGLWSIVTSHWHLLVKATFVWELRGKLLLAWRRPNKRKSLTLLSNCTRNYCDKIVHYFWGEKGQSVTNHATAGYMPCVKHWSTRRPLPHFKGVRALFDQFQSPNESERINLSALPISMPSTKS